MCKKGTAETGIRYVAASKSRKLRLYALRGVFDYGFHFRGAAPATECLLSPALVTCCGRRCFSEQAKQYSFRIHAQLYPILHSCIRSMKMFEYLLRLLILSEVKAVPNSFLSTW